METMTLAQHSSGVFMQKVSEAIENLTGAEAAAYVVQLHHAETNAVSARLAAAGQALEHALLDGARRHHLMVGVTETAKRETIRASHFLARAELAEGLLRKVEALVGDEDEALPVGPLLAVLSAPRSRHPAWRPTMMAFHASTQFRVGHFMTEDGTAHHAFAFSGWMLVDDAEGAEPELVPAFLVDAVVVPATALYRNQGLKLQSLT